MRLPTGSSPPQNSTRRRFVDDHDLRLSGAVALVERPASHARECRGCRSRSARPRTRRPTARCLAPPADGRGTSPSSRCNRPRRARSCRRRRLPSRAVPPTVQPVFEKLRRPLRVVLRTRQRDAHRQSTPRGRIRAGGLQPRHALDHKAPRHQQHQRDAQSRRRPAFRSRTRGAPERQSRRPPTSSRPQITPRRAPGRSEAEQQRRDAAAPRRTAATPPSSEIPSNPTRVSPPQNRRAASTIRRSGIIDAASRDQAYATTSPATAALASDSSRLSVISCRTMRQRLAPSASRIATSR